MWSLVLLGCTNGSWVGEPSAARRAANSAPVADAGADQSVLLGDVVTLDSSTSSDADGDPLTSRWKFTEVPTGSALWSNDITDRDAAITTFTPDAVGTWRASVRVDDGVDSDRDEVDIVVTSASNTAPVAVAPDVSGTVGSAMTVDASGSSDADGDALTYRWKFTGVPSGSTLGSNAIDDRDAAMTSFTPDVAGTWQLVVKVSDGVETTQATVEAVSIAADTGDSGGDTGGDTGVLTSDELDANDVVFNEVAIYEPSSCTAQEAQWVELLNRSGRMVDLTGLEIRNSAGESVTLSSGLVLADGEYVLGARLAAASQCFGLSSDFLADMDFADGELSLVASDGTVLQDLTISSGYTAGVQLSTNASDEDDYTSVTADRSNYCSTQYNGTLHGTPGSDNSLCSTPVDVAASDDMTIVLGETAEVWADTWDGDGDTTVVKWQLQSTPSASALGNSSISDRYAETITITPDVVGTFKLLVRAGNAYPPFDDSERVDITVVLTDTGDTGDTSAPTNQAPLAYVTGSDTTGATNAAVTLDASASLDPDGDALTYRWKMLSVPAGSALWSNNIADRNAATTSFVPDVYGTYLLNVKVDDGSLTDEEQLSAVISAGNNPPQADAGIAVAVTLGETLTLDASGSSDADGDTLTYRWKVLSVPAGSALWSNSIADRSAATTTFTPDVTGDFSFNIKVDDGTTTDEAQVTYTVAPVSGTEGSCDDGSDGDGDGLVDCEDADCAADEVCVELDCADREDSDDDGFTDCWDDDCVGTPICESSFQVVSGTQQYHRDYDQYYRGATYQTTSTTTATWSASGWVEVPYSSTTVTCSWSVAAATLQRTSLFHDEALSFTRSGAALSSACPLTAASFTQLAFLPSMVDGLGRIRAKKAVGYDMNNGDHYVRGTTLSYSTTFTPSTYLGHQSSINGRWALSATGNTHQFEDWYTHQWGPRP